MNSSESQANIKQLQTLVAEAKTILVLQPDSPDGDSIGSALGLEEILGDLGKEVALFAYREPEPYLRHLEGWDRVSQAFPKRFDLTILVDTGAPALIKSTLEHHFTALTAKPVVVIDHHASRNPFGFDTIDIVTEDVATSELITQICLDLEWPINQQAAGKLTFALLSDSLNLTTSGTTAHSVAMLAELTRAGANLHELYKAKREASALSSDLLHLKGKLLQSVEFHVDGHLAIAEITPDMVAKYKDVAEPYTLILNEMQWTKGVELVAVFKNYGTKINVPLRSTIQAAAPIAEKFGGGGHPNAAAYRCKSLDVRAEIDTLIKTFTQYKEQQDAAVQHPDA
ncbi:MAG: putative phosphoesterase [Patescibacteria group bacterium]|nr:putative phosphoesterase [Patescibacteria group bacterium]